MQIHVVLSCYIGIFQVQLCMLLTTISSMVGTNYGLNAIQLLAVLVITSRTLQVFWHPNAWWTNCIQFISYINFQVTHLHLEENMVADLLYKEALNVSSLNQTFALLDFCISVNQNDLLGDRAFRFSIYVGFFSFLALVVFSFGYVFLAFGIFLFLRYYFSLLKFSQIVLVQCSNVMCIV